ncbi:MAG: cupin domain-containing protein [Verrucomicrobia bacterium]|nr:cupin domain-containing protein [Verrucomicrobiota bacterium]
MKTNPYKVVDLNQGRTFLKGGIASKPIHKDAVSKTILFLFDAGQQLSEHTASVSAVMHFLEGKARVQLGKRTVTVGPGSWVYMAPKLLHAIEAKTRVVMLLTLFTASTAPAGNEKSEC